MTLLNSNNVPDTGATDALTQALAAFNTGSQTAVVAANPLTAGSLPVVTNEEAEVVEDSEVDETEEAEVDEVEEDESPFAAQFEATFGMKPDEAVELVTSLTTMRDEMQLMREWAVTPVDYSSRMEKVREFYNGLPEGDREQFNSPEGAKVIWSHLEKTNPQAKSVGKSTRGGNVRPTCNQQAPKEVIKRSDILAMDDKTYKANIQRITAAYREGRVLDNQ